jgi:dipeptidyl aminopeptidase/acylaminoacyl peptidase
MWTTFSPDKSQIVTVSNVTTTSLTVVSATTGETIQQITVPAGTAGTMPDWSPDGIHLAFADVPMNAINAPGLYFRHLYGSSIGMLDVADGGFSNYQVIAQSTKACPMTQQSGTTESYANPFFSQDGRWLVYSRGDCQSEADPSSEIILSQPVASAPQNHLVTANQQTAAGAVINVENGMPILGPVPANLAADDPNRNFVWVAFTSIRDYGLVLSQDSQVNPQDSGVPSYQVKQIWLAAVDLNQLSAGVIAVDPSYPAFRFPGQDLAENTHRPFWAADVLEGVPIVVKPVP